MEYNLEMRNISNLHQMRNYDCVSQPELSWEEVYVHRQLYKTHKYRNKRTFYPEYHAINYRARYSSNRLQVVFPSPY